jgi:hypothetical protein
MVDGIIKIIICLDSQQLAQVIIFTLLANFESFASHPLVKEDGTLVNKSGFYINFFFFLKYFLFIMKVMIIYYHLIL